MTFYRGQPQGPGRGPAKSLPAHMRGIRVSPGDIDTLRWLAEDQGLKVNALIRVYIRRGISQDLARDKSRAQTIGEIVKLTESLL